MLYENGLGRYKNIYIHDTFNPIATENESSLENLISSISTNGKNFSVVIMTGTIGVPNGKSLDSTNPHTAISLVDHTKRREGDGDGLYLLDFGPDVYQYLDTNGAMVANPVVFNNLAQHITCLNTFGTLQRFTTCTYAVVLTAMVLDRKKDIDEIVIINPATNTYVLNINFFREVLKEVNDFEASYGLNGQILDVNNVIPLKSC